jgi:subtilisin family serine protease
MDEYAGYAGKAGGSAGQYRDRLMVIAAGNDGDTTGFLGTPADSFNGLVVGALDAGGSSAWDDPLRVPLPQAAPYSSWRPLANGRAGVDLVAPGTRIWSTLAINYFGQNGLVAGTADGTSLAAPHVAGEAALLYGANATPLNGLSDKGTPLSLDHKLMKAIIMNSADKIAGVDSNGTAQTEWQPGRLVWTNDVLNAEVPLNYAVGAGMANAYEAFLQFRESSNRFWHVNTLASTGSDIYYTFSDGKFTNSVQFMTNLLGVTATLVWDRHVDYTVNTDTNNLTLGTLDKDLLSNLDLVLQKETSPGQWTNVFMSAGSLDSVEHLYVPVMPGPGNYRIGVLGTEIAEPALGEQYALAVRFYTVPEPATCGLLAFGAFLMTAGRRRRRQ